MITDTAFLLIGAAAGTLHFALLRWNAALFTQTRPLWIAVACQTLRLGALTTVLTMAAVHGALPLLLAALGLLIARPFVMRWVMAV